MKVSKHMLLAGTVVLGLAYSGCTNKQKQAGGEDYIILEAEHGEHMHEVHGEGEGEESGIQLALDQVYNEQGKGTRLVLAYNEESNSFTGTVENVSDKVLDRVRVEVHLSNGTELGPTTQVDLKPGEKRLILLEAGSDDFTSWSTHAEVGSGEHSHGEGGEHSHSHEGEGGHKHN
jgi:hypothetical protein